MYQNRVGDRKLHRSYLIPKRFTLESQKTIINPGHMSNIHTNSSANTGNGSTRSRSTKSSTSSTRSSRRSRRSRRSSIFQRIETSDFHLASIATDVISQVFFDVIGGPKGDCEYETMILKNVGLIEGYATQERRLRLEAIQNGSSERGIWKKALKAARERDGFCI